MKSKKNTNKNSFKKTFDKFSTTVTKATGSPSAFLVAALIVLLWGITGPIFHYSDTWQLVINTGTTIVTFLMVFLIQQSQNKDTVALQLKLNELIACNEKASNRLIDIEDLTDDELQVLKKFYVKLSDLAEKESNLHASHSIDEAEDNNDRKKNAKPIPKK
jgi:low affinity Fe/Cu permease